MIRSINFNRNSLATTVEIIHKTMDKLSTINPQDNKKTIKILDNIPAEFLYRAGELINNILYDDSTIVKNIYGDRAGVPKDFLIAYNAFSNLLRHYVATKAMEN